jgi:hypothetical protein
MKEGTPYHFVLNDERYVNYDIIIISSVLPWARDGAT